MHANRVEHVRLLRVYRAYTVAVGLPGTVFLSTDYGYRVPLRKLSPPPSENPGSATVSD